MSRLRSLALLAALLSGLTPAHGQQARPWEEPELIVGRADADASGGWPVALLVVDGPRRVFTVRLAREQLGSLPGREWRPVDSEALMSLERYAAPQLVLQPDLDGCRTELNWRRPIVRLPSHYIRPQRPELAHASCVGMRCGGAAQAWQIELDEGDGPGLPLALLLPQLGRKAMDRLVLHVTAKDYAVRVQGLPHLPPPPRRDMASVRMTPEYWFPADAAAEFPALHLAMLDLQANSQGLAGRSIVELADPVGPAGRLAYSPHWGGEPAQRELLGFGADGMYGHYLTRLLLRLSPGDPVETLQLGTVHDHTRYADFKAIAPATASPAACEQRLQALQCVPACEERVRQVHASPRSYGLAEESLSGWPEEGYRACTAACEKQKVDVRAAVQRYYDSTADERQRHAWKFYEWMTGQPASAWRR
ncbi:hypothetical protein [Pelomonas sp. SE-A7]|uniref:hypothetical protein n=1 Tax=Pelomonas sp. SE-A7 TaxID=3054953 RepID=UPI00259CDD57|nr:hypothetical protein [Pelomonas sp. SE-A7]MDM4768420.1 hypothetical protein [Pelomonas sp. SE-A7]